MNNNNDNIRGPGCAGWFLAILSIVFVIAKLFGVITWSWWIVFSPVIIGGTASLVIIITVLIVAAIAYDRNN